VELIGREPEIERLRLFISGIAQGTGEALLLSGDPGVGKTSLLDQAAAIATGSGIRLLRATGSQFEADISFAALHQLLHPCFAELPHLTPLHAQALNVALGLGEGPPPAQLQVASAVLALLRQAAKEQPLLLVVDDLPWLDRASALVLGMVARRLAGLPVALLAACRAGEASFFDLGNLPVVRVEPLSDEAATELLASRYPVMTPRVRRRLPDTALGNPLALLELPVSLGDLAQTVAGADRAGQGPGIGRTGRARAGRRVHRTPDFPPPAHPLGHRGPVDQRAAPPSSAPQERAGAGDWPKPPTWDPSSPATCATPPACWNRRAAPTLAPAVRSRPPSPGPITCSTATVTSTPLTGC
jgi:hypothetical protein